MFKGAVAVSDANSDQVVEIAIWKTFDIQIDRRAIELRVQDIDRVYLVLADRECSQ